MQLTGRNLRMVQRGLQLAIDELQNQIGSCPDVFRYEDDLVELEAEKKQFEKLLARVERAVNKEPS